MVKREAKRASEVVQSFVRLFTHEHGKRGTKGFEVTCENCQWQEKVICKSFPAFLDRLADRLWSVVPMADKWRFFCPCCK